MRSAIATIVAATMSIATISGAQAATVSHWADISELDSGTGTTSVTVPGVGGFPDAALQTDSRGPAGRISGASTWLAASTDPGIVYGSSRDLPYLSLRPASNNSASPSTSTYTFDHPTPANGWMIALGDIDAEYLDVSGLDATGAPVSMADLGFQTAFNYCEGAGTPSCDSSKAQPAPLWDSTTGRLVGPEEDEAGAPIEWSDTDGAAAWFQPSVPLSSITITATWRSGFPAYQTWFAALSRDTSGTVSSSDDCSVDGLDVVLRDGAGDEVDRTTTGRDGAWALDTLATYDDWTVTLTPPEGCDVEGDATRTADLSSDDAVIDQQLEQTPAPDPEPEPGPESPGDTDGPASPADATGGDDAVDDSGTADDSGTVDDGGTVNPLLPDTGGPSAWIPVAGLLMLLLAAGGAVLRPGLGRHRA